MLGYVGEISPDELKQRRLRGYAAGDIIGKAGVELTYDKWLRGRDGVQDLEVNAAGEVVRALGGRPPTPGRDLQLTLDLNLQVSVAAGPGRRHAGRPPAARQRAGRHLPGPSRHRGRPRPRRRRPARPGQPAPVRPASLRRRHLPARLRQVREPPGQAAAAPGRPSAYPPGSTWKPFTALAGLKAGTITPTSTYSCPGSFTIGSYTKRDWTPRGHGAVALTDSLRLSCDVYYYNLGAQLGVAERAQEERGEKVDEKMQATARAFGFGRQPALDLPYGAEGTVPTREWRRRFWEQNKKTYCAGSSDLYRELCRGGWRWQGGDNLNVAIGQGDLQVSPLQLALGYGALANGGTVYRPHVGRAVLDPASGRVVRRVEPRVAEVAEVPDGALAAVGQALATVPAGGRRRRPSPASRWTGSRWPARPAPPTCRPAPFAWFASYAPVGNPEYVVVVMVEQGGHGGESAAPVARAIYQKLFALPPTPVAAGADRSG